MAREAPGARLTVGSRVQLEGGELGTMLYKYHTQLAKMSFDEIFDLTAGVYFNFYNKQQRGGDYLYYSNAVHLGLDVPGMFCLVVSADTMMRKCAYVF